MIDEKKLIEEIEKLKSNLIHGACSSQVAMETRCKEEAYNEVLDILDTMQKEPVSNVWHDMSEEAENGRNIIIIDPKDFYGAVLRKGDSQLKNHNKERYVKWAYIDDIINITNKEEPVSEDLEEACDSYYDETWDEHGGRAMVVDGCHDIWFPSHATDDFFKAGANWQEKKDQSIIELAEDHAMLAGMEKMKEEMMEKAVDMVVGYWMPNGLMLTVDEAENCYNIDEGDRVKVIVIKED